MTRTSIPIEEIRERHRLLLGSHVTYLYAIQAGEGGPIKIGRSINPQKRLKTLQTGQPETLKLIAMWPCLTIFERVIHHMYAEHRLEREWFRPDPELVEGLARWAKFFASWEHPT